LLGGTISFTAIVANTSDTSVSWSVNNAPGGTPQVGTISADGVYTAPPDLPQGGKVQVTAISHADPSKSSSATLAISSDISVSLSPASSSVELGALQAFQAKITSDGHPDPAILWSLSGPACPASCGSIDGNGNYTAPAILPANPNLTIIATSAADASRQASATTTITSNFNLQLAAPATVLPGSTAAIVATFTPVAGSNPDNVLNWSLSGTGCNGAACGVLTVVTTQNAGGHAIADTANYTAPVNPPQPNTVIVTVTPQADSSKKAEASIMIPIGAGLSLNPVTDTLAANHRVTFSVTETGTSGESLSWSVNGVTGGSSLVGQICVVGSSPCQALSSGATTQADYLAPGAIPSINPVSIQVNSTGNAALSSTSQVTVINHLLVSVLPNSVALPPLATQGFTASVLGSSDQAVTWQIQGAGCTAAGLCGFISPSGAYTAPQIPPTPSNFQIVAISQDDPAQSGTANVSITSGVNILSLHPASVFAGAADGFTLRVDGSGFQLSNPGPGSSLVVNGISRVTTCQTVNSCNAPINSNDVAQPANLSVQIQNPDHTVSNVVNLVVIAPSAADDVVTLSTNTPNVTGKDIVVVEPTAAGIDTTPDTLDLTVDAIGAFVPTSNTCNLAGNPIPLLRPSSGTTTADICLFSQVGFDTSMLYTISGPGDISVLSRQPAGLGIIHLTLQIPSSATPGARTLFVQNANLDKTAASGVLEIQ